MDNLYPWKKWLNIERGHVWANQLSAATYTCSIGDRWDFDAIMSNRVLNYVGGISSKIRDGVQIKECFVEIEIKNNSNIDYIVDKYILKPRFDSSERVSTVCNNSFTSMTMLNQGVAAACSPNDFGSAAGNFPPNLTLYDLPEVTAHFKFKKTRFILKAGRVCKFTLHPDRLENKIFNSAVLYGNDKIFKAGRTKHVFMVFAGCMAHEGNPVTPAATGATVRSEVEGLDIEQIFHYCARMVKEPTEAGNFTKYDSPVFGDLLQTNIAVPNGAHVTTARDYP